MVTSLISKGKGQGYLLSDEISAAFPDADEQDEPLQSFYSALVAEGIDSISLNPDTVVDTWLQLAKSKAGG